MFEVEATNGQSANRLRRFRRASLIFMAFSVTIAGLYVWKFWHDRQHVPPVALYHLVYDGVMDNLYDQSHLKDIVPLEHKYDEQIKTTADAVKYANEMLKTLDDPFTIVSDERAISRRDDANKGFYSGVGMIMTAKHRPIRVRMVMEESPALKAGIKPGDEIISVDNLDCSKIPPMEIGNHTRKHLGETVRFVIRRHGKVMEIPIIPCKMKVLATHMRMLDKEIGYERIESFVPDDLTKIVEDDLSKLVGAKALILDLRGNPGGSVNSCLDIATLFLDSGDLVTLKSRLDKGKTQAVRYSLKPDTMEVVTTANDKTGVTEQARKPNLTGKKPIYILVDEASASAAEMLAAMLRDNNRGVLIGQRTYGKGVMQIFVPLPNDTALAITAGRYYTPSGAWLGNGKFDEPEDDAESKSKLGAESKSKLAAKPSDLSRGIAPDIVIKPVDDLQYGAKNDNQLNDVLLLARKELDRQKAMQR